MKRYLIKLYADGKLFKVIESDSNKPFRLYDFSVGNFSISNEYCKTYIIKNKLEIKCEEIEDSFVPIIKKPPLGLTPQIIWYEQRIKDIEEAIDRYKKANKEIPLEWTDELLELCKILL